MGSKRVSVQKWKQAKGNPNDFTQGPPHWRPSPLCSTPLFAQFSVLPAKTANLLMPVLTCSGRRDPLGALRVPSQGRPPDGTCPTSQAHGTPSLSSASASCQARDQASLGPTAAPHTASSLFVHSRQGKEPGPRPGPACPGSPGTRSAPIVHDMLS